MQKFQDAHQYIEADAIAIHTAIDKQVEQDESAESKIIFEMADGQRLELGLWSTDVIHIIQTMLMDIAEFAKSQYTAE